jgi:hypothetical protein
MKVALEVHYDIAVETDEPRGMVIDSVPYLIVVAGPVEVLGYHSKRQRSDLLEAWSWIREAHPYAVVVMVHL